MNAILSTVFSLATACTKKKKKVESFQLQPQTTRFRRLIERTYAAVALDSCLCFHTYTVTKRTVQRKRIPCDQRGKKTTNEHRG